MKLEWVNIPAGTFWLGSEKGESHEKPVHQVYLDAYQIGKTPVTNAQYELFVAATGQAAPSHWQEEDNMMGVPAPTYWQKGSVNEALAAHPVVNVDWHEALAYCHWLSDVTGKAITLPSEAQWEKAARGDSDKREYPWGDTFDPKRANTVEGGLDEMVAVSSFPQGASPYGVLDMSGNVWEWTSSLFKAYPYQPDDGREGLADISAKRVLRGGSWAGSQNLARVAYRDFNAPGLRLLLIGFRVVAG